MPNGGARLNKVKKLISVILCVITVFFCIPAYADGEVATLSVISANVSGLPEILSKYDRDVPRSQKTLGRMLCGSGYDIICVQEDFGYHDILAAEMKDYPYRTYATGGVPIGDGLNIFSKYPLYNVERVKWDKHNGVFSDGSDALTPKGFLKCTVDVGGILIDLYNVHCDAYRTDADQLVKKAQLIQLTEYIEANSVGRPVLVTGDTNLTFHNDPLSEMYRIMISEGGFTDCWVEVKNNGNYFEGDDGPALIQSWYDKFGGHDWGRWDSVERVLYRDGDGLSFTPTRFEYTIYTDMPNQIKALTDHRIMECVLELDTDNYQKPSMTLTKEDEPSYMYTNFRRGIMTARCVFIIFVEILTLNLPATAAVLLALTALVILIKKHKSKKKKSA